MKEGKYDSVVGGTLSVGFRSQRIPAPKAQIYSRFVNKLFSNVNRVIKKYMLSLTQTIIYLQGVSRFRSRQFL